MDEDQSVAGLQWRLAVAAVVAAGIAAALGLAMGPYLGGYFVLSAGAAALPLLMRDWPKGFSRVCLAAGAGLLAWSLIGAVIGMFLFVPAALLLFFAAFSGDGNRPGAWPALAAPVAAVAAVAAFYLQPPDPDNEPPPSFQATLDSMSRGHDRDFNRGKERLRDFGATRVEVGEHPVGLVLTVGIPKGFAEESQDRLEEQIRQLPGVVDVRFCTFHTCD
ncbi:hypothetical protein ACFWA6_01015 [Streptomyces sp. NPDC060020]|uniref:hypothetical protein n=1 Tax=Streptomyces sp. NPDC060020 TaxID=3347038 RepID=UPI00367F8A98